MSMAAMGALKIRHQHFDFAAGDAFANGFDRERKEFGAPVLTVVAIHASDDRVAQAQSGASFGHAARLVEIDSERRRLFAPRKTRSGGCRRCRES